jgi:hypothetical protein
VLAVPIVARLFERGRALPPSFVQQPRHVGVALRGALETHARERVGERALVLGAFGGGLGGGAVELGLCAEDEW